ncbi:biotin carboxylase N-terminal domain-containing protein [Paenibacillus humicola]|uniref:ATP-binding protein n=1 Tax=Paenibacillus humicola TaxID=3110540 RepID=UPI00237B0D99|nr:biotin carboxylase N-terminal domain-containing protein [Paenibacillus humicola]
MFTKVLIANRGAIAVRIERTLRRLGVASVAVYTKADQDSLHVDMADEAVPIGEGPAKDSYLNAELILRVAEETGAQAIHPGYGFLSENADFARACRERGIVFIGPSPEQMELFGLKHSAREIAGRAGVPMLPGTPLIERLEEALAAAEGIGYPVMLKSTAGGGGIGMRICGNEGELRAAYEGVRHLAEANFNNGGVFLEKYIERARHVEVQIFGNAFGEAVALGERDCSIQRRNQKVIEESPAPILPEDVRAAMFEAARRLAAEVGYRSAGTVEFLYDPKEKAFYFLEVNTRLQVEHGVTEEVLGIDLVEWMVREAAGELTGIASLVRKPRGHSIQARIYAEDCLRDFRPSAGQLDRAVFSAHARNETWVRDGMTVTTLYDPMLAKIIVHGESREDAIRKLAAALSETRMYGLTTNLHYLQALLGEPDVLSGNVYTRLLGGFAPAEPAIEVLDGGVQTTVQDYPGRTGHWDVGVPPCGPMDPLSFRIGNRLLGNDEGAPGLELTLRGGSYVFRGDARFCVTGADMQPELDGRPVSMYAAVRAGRGQTLSFGEAAEGMRAYLLVEGGFDMPDILGSASTFTLGGFGGHGGRALRTGDVLTVRRAAAAAAAGQAQAPSGAAFAHPAGEAEAPGHDTGSGREGARQAEAGAAGETAAGAGDDRAAAEPSASAPGTLAERPLPAGCRPAIARTWTIGVIPGPHCTTEFLQPGYLEQLSETEWEVHFNSSRTGVRLIGPAPRWAREDGGEAGLHPSNIHDNAYAVGTLDLTGDMPILLGPDGPSLGGFVCPATTASAEFWKLGQLHPGDKVRFELLTLERAETLRQEQERLLALIGENRADEWTAPAVPADRPAISPEYPVLAREGEETGRRFPVTIRCAGDENLLVEYGPMELDLTLRFQVHALMQAIERDGTIPVRDLTPGIRSLQVHLNSSLMTVKEAARRMMEIDRALPPLESIRVPSRIVKLPLSWDDPSTRLAIDRYQQNVRPDAPWCPSNIEFIRRINGLSSTDEVKEIVFGASYLVLGLGDVYLGAPVATPIDPRHRLVTTKYNPARTWTPENAVGIGGAYMCVYGMEGPGGYQFVGRTIQMWNKLRATESFKPGKPWLLRFFDQIRFYPVEAEELTQLRDDFVRGRFEAEIEETTFDLGDYLRFLDSIEENAREFRDKQRHAFREERERWKALGLAEYVSEQEPPKPQQEETLPEGAVAMRCSMPGSVWKVLAKPGQQVKKGDPIMIQESMKMEFMQQAPCDGEVIAVFVNPGDGVQPGQPVAYIRKLEVLEETEHGEADDSLQAVH